MRRRMRRIVSRSCWSSDSYNAFAEFASAARPPPSLSYEALVMRLRSRDCHSFQCGFCTPGFLMTAYAYLQEDHEFSEHEIREELSGNLCRCTGYQSIVAGVALAAIRLGKRKEEAAS